MPAREAEAKKEHEYEKKRDIKEEHESETG